MLNITKAKAMKSGDPAISDGSVKGLRLHPHRSQNGRGAWKLRFTSPVTKKRRDLGLGTFPDVGIADARDAASAAQRLVAAGKDPIDERKSAASAAVVETLTFEVAARKRFEELSPGFKNAKHRAAMDQHTHHLYVPVYREHPVGRSQGCRLRGGAAPIWLKKPETAQRVKQRCHEVMDWAYSQDMTSGNPVLSVARLLPKQPPKSKRVQHHPAMPWRQVSDFYSAKLAGGQKSTHALMTFVILTAARSGEARAATWDEIDIDAAIWTVPADRMKAGVEHRVPLSSPAVALLREVLQRKRNDLVFPAPQGGVLTDMALTTFLRRHKVPSDTAGRTATAHGFRSSFRDWASENGYPRDLAERALAHTIKNQAEAAYHRTDLLDQRRPMMEAWGKLVVSA